MRKLLNYTQAACGNVDHDEISTLGPVRYQVGTSPFVPSLPFYHIQIHLEKVVSLEVNTKYASNYALIAEHSGALHSKTL